eukprot:XP_024302054.1 uncharacterized protein LOC112267947 isoform X1 [Homo sapiens]
MGTPLKSALCPVPASVPRCPAPGHSCRPCLGQPAVPGGGLAPAAPRPGRSLAFQPVGGRPRRPRASPQGLRRVPGPLPPPWPGLPAPGRSCARFSASRVCVACSAQRPPPRSAPCRTPRCCGRGGSVAVRAVSVRPHRLPSADFLCRGPELPARSDAAECRNGLPVCQSGLPRTPSEATRSSRGVSVALLKQKQQLHSPASGGRHPDAEGSFLLGSSARAAWRQKRRSDCTCVECGRSTSSELHDLPEHDSVLHENYYKECFQEAEAGESFEPGRQRLQ